MASILVRLGRRLGSAVGRVQRFVSRHKATVAVGAVGLYGMLLLATRRDWFLFMTRWGQFGIGPRPAVHGLDPERAVDVPIMD